MATKGDEAAYRERYGDMDVASLLAEWDEPLSDVARAALLAELEERGVRVKGLAPPQEEPRDPEQRARDKVRLGAAWLLIVGILQAVGGGFLGARVAAELRDARADLEGLAPDETVTFDGGSYSVAELRRVVDRSEVLVIAFPVGLGLVFIGLFFWARRSPLPALMTALVLFVTVHVADAVLDPAALYRGIVMKVVVVLALLGGIRAAVARPDPEGVSADGEAAAT